MGDEMTREVPSNAPSGTEVFKALGDPIRWSIVQQMAAVDELACSILEDTLPISKPTISYHTKILIQAGLVSVRKESRNLYYTLRRDVIEALVQELWAVAPTPRPVHEGKIVHAPARRRATRGNVALDPAVDNEPILLTW
jgi:DNA-binding transcriptional ArsR family regulator